MQKYLELLFLRVFKVDIKIKLRRTNEEHRTKWHRKDKILFVWTVLKYFELTNKTDLNPVNCV